MAIPIRDEPLAEWSTNANTRLVADGVAVYKLTAGQVSAYTPLHDAFIAAFDAVKAARAAGTRSENLTAAKDDAKKALLVYARQIYGIVQANGAVSDADKILLGVKVKDVEPSPSTLPADPPSLTVVSVTGRVVRVQLRDPANPDRRALPDSCVGAIVMCHIGETAPTDPFQWAMQGPTGKTTTEVVFPNTVPAGAKVWLSAVWMGGRKQIGQACPAVCTFIGDSMSMAA